MNEKILNAIHQVATVGTTIDRDEFLESLHKLPRDAFTATHQLTEDQCDALYRHLIKTNKEKTLQQLERLGKDIQKRQGKNDVTDMLPGIRSHMKAVDAEFPNANNVLDESNEKAFQVLQELDRIEQRIAEVAQYTLVDQKPITDVERETRLIALFTHYLDVIQKKIIDGSEEKEVKVEALLEEYIRRYTVENKEQEPYINLEKPVKGIH